MKTEFIIVRHGEAVSNRDGFIGAQHDVPLTKRGELQVAACAEALRHEKIDVVFSSDLSRAKNTALAHLRYHDVPFYMDADLREVDAGDFTLQTWKDIKEKLPDEHDRFLSLGSMYCFPNGESGLSASERFEGALRRIAEQHGNKRILVGAHGGVMRAFFCRIYGFPLTEVKKRLPFLDNVSVSRCVYDNGVFIPISYAECVIDHSVVDASDGTL